MNINNIIYRKFLLPLGEGKKRKYNSFKTTLDEGIWIWKLIFGIIFTFCIFSFTFASTDTLVIQNRVSDVIKQYVTAKFPNYKNDKIDISFSYTDRIFNKLAEKSEPLEFEVLELYPNFRPIGNVIVPLQVKVAGQARERLFLRTSVKILKMALVASDRLKRGDIISKDNIVSAEVEVSSKTRNFYTDAKDVLGREVVAYIPKGGVIFEEAVRKPPLIAKGQEVTIIATGKDIEVKAKGIAIEDGYLGKEIKVRRLQSNVEFRGKVLNENTVEVNLK